MHNALAYVIIGSLVVHVGVKLRIIARYWRARDAYDADGRFVADPTVGSELLPDTGLEDRGASAPYPRGLTGRLLRWVDGVPAVGEPAESRAARHDSDATSRDSSPSASLGSGDPDRGPAADGAGAGRASRPAVGATEGGRERIARRGFVAGVTAATVGVVALTAGQSTRLLEPFNVFGARQRHLGPDDLPVNRTARAAGVLATATAADWTLTVVGPGMSRTFSRAELVALGTTTAELPIACVEGWSQTATWKGVRMRDLLETVQADPASPLRITSLERSGGYRVTEMGPEYAADPTTLVALELNGATLDLDHGFPARVIAPGRPGVLQTKWIGKIEVIR
ncbi:molybdopterin-dependent oxidoreductase [Curtobacterium sp. Csp2]|nr:molybdopterin-dependent oxidoreductase [Curtobacterium sp. Csp2]